MLSQSDLTDSSRERLLLEHLPQVQHIARRIHERLPRQVLIEDLVQCGVLGLIDAVRRYDPRKRVKLKHYAEFRIRGAILDSLRQDDWASRSQRRMGRKIEQATAGRRAALGRDPTEAEVASAMHVNLEVIQRSKTELRSLAVLNCEFGSCDLEIENAISAVAEREQSPYHAALKSEMAELIEKAIDALPERERKLVDMYYFKELTMKEIAAALGVGESRISQIHASILARLRASLRIPS
jgi:RNA polymerase sigma factor for flagellar operon FliA